MAKGTAAALQKALEGGADVQHAAAMVAEGVDANSDLHASAEYRTHLAVVHAARAILAAMSRTA